MQLKLILPALLIAAVLPFFLTDHDWPQRLQQSLSAMPAQIGGSSGTSGSSTPASPSYDFNNGTRGSTTSPTTPTTPANPSPSYASPNASSSPSYSSPSTTASDRGPRYTPATPTGGTSGTSGSHTSGSGSSPPAHTGADAASDGSIEGPPVQNLTEVFRFDVTPRWVTGRWPRVSTVLSEAHLEGLRVPLVTGKAPDDVAGSLTYYFDKQHVVQRLTFHGYTGDDTRIVALATQSFGLKSKPTLGAGLYLLSWGGASKSALRINLAPVVRSADIHRRLEVMLEINRPRSYYGMSPEFEKLLEQDRSNARG